MTPRAVDTVMPMEKAVVAKDKDEKEEEEEEGKKEKGYEW